MLSALYQLALVNGLPPWLEKRLRARGRFTVRVARPSPDRRRLRAVVRQILWHRRSDVCARAATAIELDKARTCALLGDLPADPRPLPSTSFRLEADALQGCATPETGGRLLFAVVRALRPGTAVEIGTAHGYGALYIGSALRENGSGHLWTLEGMDVRVKLSREVVQRFRLTSEVRVVDGDFTETVPATLAARRPLDLVFSDGNKDPEMTHVQFHLALNAMPMGGHMFFDDIAFSPEIASLWASIVNHPRVACCVEFCGRWGLVEVTKAPDAASR
jgi:predicted O-methyltransferase YrrM